MIDSMNNDVKTGRFISLVLRHQPDAAGIELDNNGWTEVGLLIKGMNEVGRKIDMETLERIVEENDKKRFEFNEDRSKIRASQGHSVEVDVELKECEPPEYLYHGTATRFVGSIYKEGLKKQSRNHVHLSADKVTAVKVGSRHGMPKVLKIFSKEMYNKGFVFYLSANGVWLTEFVPKKYIVSADV